MKHFQNTPNPHLERDVRAASVLSSPPSLIPAAVETTVFSALLLSLFLGGMLGCIATGFSLPVIPSVLAVGVFVSVWTILLWNRISRRMPLLWALLPSVVLLYGHFRFEALRDGLCYLTAGIFRYLCAGYPGLQMPSFLEEHAQFLSQAEINTLLLSSVRLPISECMVCIAVLLGILWVVLYQNLHAVCFCAFLALPPFVLCFLIIETTIPSLWALLALLLYWVLLLFTRSAVRLHMRAAAAQAWVLLIPTILFLATVYVQYPQQTPVGDIVRDGYDRVLQVLSSLETTVSNTAGTLFSGAWADVSAEGKEIAFDGLGPRQYLGRTVMRAKSNTAGVVYLRENTYASYTDHGWLQTDLSYLDPQTADAAYATYSAEVLAASGVSRSHLTLDGARSDLLFSPYYFADASVPYTAVGDCRVQNDDRSADYDITYFRFSGDFRSLNAVHDAAKSDLDRREYMTFLHHSVYGEIDDTLSEQLRAILSKNGIRVDSVSTAFVFEDGAIATVTDYDAMWDTVADITYFVRGCAEYSLDAAHKPDGDDFVLWFLQEAEYGYCVHFATAEVMLLRACGIPARLAAGYLADIRTPDKWTAIKDSNAHAWAEVYDDRLGWVPIEATPSSAIPSAVGTDDIIVGATAAEDSPSTPQTEPVSPDDPTAPSTDTLKIEDTDHISQPDPSNGQEPSDPQTGTGTSPNESGDASVGTHTEPSPKQQRILWLLWIPLSVGVSAAAFFLWYRYRRRQAQTLLSPTESTRNASALRLYRRCAALAHTLGEALPTTLTELAEKARFSQHTLTEEEMAVLVRWYLDACAKRKERRQSQSAKMGRKRKP